METSIEVIGFSKIYNNNIHIPIDIIRNFKLKDGDKLFWIITKNGDLAIRKKINIELTKRDRFIVNTSD